MTTKAEDTVTTYDLMDEAGCTHRQIDHWVREGYVRPVGERNPGTGSRRRFTTGEVFIAKIVTTLSSFGFGGDPLAAAVGNIRDHSPAARLVYIQADGTTHWGPGDTAAIVIDLDQLRRA